MIPIYIPSMKRHTLAALMAGPLVDLSPEALRRTTYVVPLDEVELYRGALWEAGPRFSEVMVHGTTAVGIAETRLIIGQYAADIYEESFVMMDDDVRFLVRRGDDDWRLRGTTPQEVDSLLLEIEDWLLKPDVAHVAVSAREGNNRIGVGPRAELHAENTRTLRVLAYDTEQFLSVQHGRVEVMEDFDVNLQLLEQGLRNVCLHYHAQGQKMTNAPGGCSTYRSHEVQDRSARRLAELHPGVVSLRTKHNKTDAEGLGTRTEVTIQWKKAYEQGKTARAVRQKETAS